MGGKRDHPKIGTNFLQVPEEVLSSVKRKVEELQHAEDEAARGVKKQKKEGTEHFQCKKRAGTAFGWSYIHVDEVC